MNLPTTHIERIRDLGYTDSEARFLYIVAVFSGYFTLDTSELSREASTESVPPPLLRNSSSKVMPPSATTCGEAPYTISSGTAPNVVWTSGGNWAASRRAVRTDGG
jgi:hypothetical protein